MNCWMNVSSMFQRLKINIWIKLMKHQPMTSSFVTSCPIKIVFSLESECNNIDSLFGPHRGTWWEAFTHQMHFGLCRSLKMQPTANLKRLICVFLYIMFGSARPQVRYLFVPMRVRQSLTWDFFFTRLLLLHTGRCLSTDRGRGPDPDWDKGSVEKSESGSVSEVGTREQRQTFRIPGKRHAVIKATWRPNERVRSAGRRKLTRTRSTRMWKLLHAAVWLV